MNDRYLFKAKRIEDEEWVTGALLSMDDGDFYIATSCLTDSKTDLLTVCAHRVVEETICMCTGLEDKAGNLIWENDIVGCYDEEHGNYSCVATVEYGRFNCDCCHGIYGWYFSGYGDIREVKTYEVLGNVFDNKDLFEVER